MVGQNTLEQDENLALARDRELEEARAMNKQLLSRIAERDQANQKLKETVDMQELQLKIRAKEKEIQFKKSINARKKQIRAEVRAQNNGEAVYSNPAKLANHLRTQKQHNNKNYVAQYETELQRFAKENPQTSERAKLRDFGSYFR